MFDRDASKRTPFAGPKTSAPFSKPRHIFQSMTLVERGSVTLDLDREALQAHFAKRTNGVADLQRHRREALELRAEAAATRAAERQVRLEFRDAERRNAAIWIKVRTKRTGAAEFFVMRAKVRSRGFPGGRRSLPKYAGPVVDRLVRRGVFVRIRYYSSRANDGVAGRVVRYIYVGAAIDPGQGPMIASNVGLSIDEIMAGFDHLERANRAAQKNAKVAFHMVANVPHQLTIDDMMEIGKRFAEQAFGDRDLPFVVALHAPSEEGDQRNWHLHIVFSTRPMVRTGDHEWQIGTALRSDRDNKAAFLQLRELFAEIQTDVAQDAGMKVAYTALGNAARGLPNKPLIHLSGKRTEQVRNGELVEANEVNQERIVEGTLALIDAQLQAAARSMRNRLLDIDAALGRYARPVTSCFPSMRVWAAPPIQEPLPSAACAGRINPHAPLDPMVTTAATGPLSNLKVVFAPKRLAPIFGLVLPPSIMPRVSQTPSAALSLSPTLPLVARVVVSNILPSSSALNLSSLATPLTVNEPVASTQLRATPFAHSIATARTLTAAQFPTLSLNVTAKLQPSATEIAEGRSPTPIELTSLSLPLVRPIAAAPRLAPFVPAHFPAMPKPTSRLPLVVPLQHTTGDGSRIARMTATSQGIGFAPSFLPMPTSQAKLVNVSLELTPKFAEAYEAAIEKRRVADELNQRRVRDAELAKQRDEDRQRLACDVAAALLIVEQMSHNQSPKPPTLRNDGFGGITSDAAPRHDASVAFPAHAAPFDADFEPTIALLEVLIAARKHAWSFHIATDCKLTTDQDAPAELRASVHALRDDSEAAGIMRDMVRRARIGDDRRWPPEVDARMRAYLRANPSADPDRHVGTRSAPDTSRGR
jgi:MobA/MobL family